MEKKRSVQNIVICGKRGCGKTSVARKLIKDTGKDKTLVLDLEYHPDYRDFSPIQADQVKRFRRGNAILFEGVPDENILTIATDLYNSVVILEDAMRYIHSNMTNSVKRLFTQSKQHDLDIITMFHYLNNIPVKMMGFIDYLIIFKTTENIDTTLKKFTNADQVREVYQRVMSHPSPYYCEAMPFL